MYQRLYSTSGKLGWPILWNVTKGLVVAHQGLSKIYSKLYWTFQQIEIKPRELFELFKSRQEQNGSLKSCHNFRESQFVSIILHSAANLAMRVKLKEDLTKKIRNSRREKEKVSRLCQFSATFQVHSRSLACPTMRTLTTNRVVVLSYFFLFSFSHFLCLFPFKLFILCTMRALTT